MLAGAGRLAGEGGRIVTFWDLLRACRRLWFVVVAGLLMTAGASLWVASQQGVYFAQTDLIFLAPTSSRFPNSLNTASESLINTASVIKNRVDIGEDLQATSSSSVTLVDDGIRDGMLVRLPNLGGQWASNYSQAVLDIQAVSDSSQVVEERMHYMQDAIQGALNELQDEAGVDDVNRIHIQASPDSIQLKYVQGRPSRALLVTVALGIGLTSSLVVFLDARQEDWRFRRVARANDLASNSRNKRRKVLSVAGRGR